MIVPLAEAFTQALEVLRAGGVVALPTDTVYGLAALPADPAAMRRLFELKARSDAKSIAVLVAGLDQARRLTAAPLERFAPFWPGPLTVVVPRRDGVALHLGADTTTVGVRCPDLAFVRALAAELGPVAATSANRSGASTCTTAAAVASEFPELGLVIDGGVIAGSASTVVDATAEPPALLRAGSVTAAMLGLGSPPAG